MSDCKSGLTASDNLLANVLLSPNAANCGLSPASKSASNVNLSIALC